MYVWWDWLKIKMIKKYLALYGFVLRIDCFLKILICDALSLMTVTKGIRTIKTVTEYRKCYC